MNASGRLAQIAQARKNKLGTYGRGTRGPGRQPCAKSGHARRRRNRPPRRRASVTFARPTRRRKLHDYPETDSLYIELRPGPGTETRELSSGVNIELAGAVIGLDIDRASKTLDLTTLETVALPLSATRAA